jgi:alpha,alpha-trehalase
MDVWSMLTSSSKPAMRGSVRGVEKALAAWQARPAGAHVLLLLDFDGTLAEFAPDPSAVHLPEGRLELLQSIVARADITLGIVSGRRIADMRERTGVGATVFYAGLHGLEIDGPGLRFMHAAAALVAPTIGVLEKEMTKAMSGLPGVFIEDKGWSLVLHVRGASKPDRLHATTRFRTLAEPYLSDGVLRVQPGDEMIELLPNVDWTKGEAVQCIIHHVETQRQQPVWPVYIGDDATDEDAFEVIGNSGLTIAVSDRPVGASFRVPDPAAVEEFLRQISKID